MVVRTKSRERGTYSTATFITAWSYSGRLPISRNQLKVSKHGEFMGTPITFQMLSVVYIGEDRARLGRHD